VICGQGCAGVDALAWPVSFITTRRKLSNKKAKRFEETHKVKRRVKIVKWEFTFSSATCHPVGGEQSTSVEIYVLVGGSEVTRPLSAAEPIPRLRTNILHEFEGNACCGSGWHVGGDTVFFTKKAVQGHCFFVHSPLPKQSLPLHFLPSIPVLSMAE
jgi:hypothetical protein